MYLASSHLVRLLCPNLRTVRISEDTGEVEVMTAGKYGRCLKKKKPVHPRRLSPYREAMGSILDERCMPTGAESFYLGETQLRQYRPQLVLYQVTSLGIMLYRGR